MSNYILEQLYVENKDNNLVIFVGLEISRYYSNLPEVFPDWEMLIDKLKEGLNIDFNKNKDYLRIAQIFEDKYGRKELNNILIELFPEHVNPGKLHELLFEVKPAHIITTNYDSLIEKALEGSYKKLQYQVLKKDQDFPYALKYSKWKNFLQNIKSNIANC
ncbi:SIR2 family protein [Thermosipho ferrireducens]|uniref:SIR2 family protein n=1 Tax=Thermosipho ferrireducens TaxID=2571116 RepID=A0ABX7SAN9_9BACT|nr:SIR2 family protein [Thermosipho ferrireducens]QTA38508.1 SIR2 family protein [Thermosipho ferrireducens]